jgi:ribonuclease HI
MKLDIYTDGSATTVDKPGGWAAVIVIDGVQVDELSGYMEHASNNDAELQSAIEGVKFACTDEFLYKYTTWSWEHHDITLVSDSQLILGWASGVFQFKQESKMHKYKELMEIIYKFKIGTRWVRGHSGDIYNERCDKLANAARLSLSNKQELEENKLSGETQIGKKKTGIVCLWYKDKLKIIDLDNSIIEDYDRDIHGSRGAILEIREEKSR